MVESALPESGHLFRPVHQRRQRTELRAVAYLATFLAIAYEPGLFEQGEMLGNRRLRDTGSSSQRADRLLAFATQSLEESPPRRIGERSEQHIVNFRHLL